MIVACQILAATTLDLSTVKGAILFGALPVLAAMPILLWRTYCGIHDEAALARHGN